MRILWCSTSGMIYFPYHSKELEPTDEVTMAVFIYFYHSKEWEHTDVSTVARFIGFYHSKVTTWFQSAYMPIVSNN